MWMFKPFTSKEQNGLEGRTIDIGNLKVQVGNAIAEGGFSCVYLARDVAHGSKQYALKHMICNDDESLELVMKEISVMKSLKGHPNVVTLHAHTFFDMGRRKEALLVMEYCEKSLVSVLESRGSGFFEEKQVLTIFRDVCNAVFAVHCQSPPIAHRDLKAENVLLGPDGLWKLCDFGSISTNHKRFEKPEEMGIEEDNIRKYTTPAYRAPEMWDLLRRELINEKVDIWALGCLLFRVCYFKSAFDGESKLQILNGNYRIPDLPKYSTSITDLIRDMLQSSPDARPDITQVWFRVNNLLPDGLQKSLPDSPPEMQQQGTNGGEGISKLASKSNPMPRRSPPPPPLSSQPTRNASATQNSRAGGGGSALGAFWTTQHAEDSVVQEDRAKAKFDSELTSPGLSRPNRNHPDKLLASQKTSPGKPENLHPHPSPNNLSGEKSKSSKPDSTSFQSEAFTAFVAEFSSSKLSPGSNSRKSGKEELEAEVEKLKEQLAQANMEKAEMTSKYEKLSAICRSQRQEIHELKQALTVRTPSLNSDAMKSQSSHRSQPSNTPQREKIEGTVWELQKEMFDRSSASSGPQPWQAFADDDSKAQTSPINKTSTTIGTINGHQNKEAADTSPVASRWGFGTDNFRAVPTASSQINTPRGSGLSKVSESKSTTQPAGWAGF